jgi:hypothetical protein
MHVSHLAGRIKYLSTAKLGGYSGRVMPAAHCAEAVVVGNGSAIISLKSNRAALGTCGSWRTRDFT